VLEKWRELGGYYTGIWACNELQGYRNQRFWLLRYSDRFYWPC
jgi:hypothetical protein